MKYPIAEKFFSIQGEGCHTGVPMAFVRLSGCPVGGVEGICRDWSGMPFICDTGQSYPDALKGAEHHPYTEIQERLTAEELWEWSKDIPTLLLTGGEPLAQDLSEIIKTRPPDRELHIETSGLYDIDLDFDQSIHIWLTVSPKSKGPWEAKMQNWPAVKYADELKLLVGLDTTVDEIETWLELVKADPTIPIYLQPIEYPDPSITAASRSRTIEMILRRPERYRLSAQLHKFLKVR